MAKAGIENGTNRLSTHHTIITTYALVLNHNIIYDEYIILKYVTNVFMIY